MTASTLQRPVHWRDYYELTKPKVVMLIVFDAVVGMVLAVPGWPGAIIMPIYVQYLPGLWTLTQPGK